MNNINNQPRNKWSRNEIIGICLVLLSVIILFFSPSSLSDLVDVIIGKVYPVAIEIFLISNVGVAVIVSVIVGRILERLGFTDGLIRVFLPIMKFLKINPSVIIPGVYNVLGDINAAGRIAGPVLVQANATRDEQKMGIATMIQAPQSFATFVIGLIALSKFRIPALPVILLSIIAPLVVIPFLLKATIYRDTRRVELEELPRFTPDTPLLETLFSSAIEGTELLLLVIIPAIAAVFSVIGVLDYFGIWAYIESGLTSMLQFLHIEPATGIVTILASPTLAMAQLIEVVESTDPRLIVGSFVLANSGLPLSVIFGQIPTTWKPITNLTEKEILNSALIGTVIRLITAFTLAFLLTPLII
ncbi:hypothetical protein [Tissierella sp. Yu-01]|uniref:hypothetical protein n=1 Tax=Tissierella sp. Yu-01 TaxID=3035694 RepID=UPI00240D15E4|nr:hypothetical protein [Tissierella sp. Yu-01]WFA08442.1 hypothetical protein P3962_12015 [Tissierella sp. Yu-01]